MRYRLQGAGLEQTFFLQGSNSLGRQGHSDFLAIDHERLFLKVWLEDTLCATQAKAHVMSVLLAFTGEFTSCCHIFSFTTVLYYCFWS